MVDSEVTQDAVLGGALTLRQPRRGHRVGHDAILLAAATLACAGEHAVEFGAGVGAAGLALARRVAGLRVTLVEIDPCLAELARQNAALNGLGDRVAALAADVTDAGALAAGGLTRGTAQRILMNPPFNDPARQNVSPDAERRRAHVAARDTLPAWLHAAETLLAPSGTLTLIWRTDGLAEVLAALGHGFGGVTIRPIFPKPATAAIRVLIGATKGSRAPLSLHPGLTLNDADGRPTAEAEAVLRAGEALMPATR